LWIHLSNGFLWEHDSGEEEGDGGERERGIGERRGRERTYMCGKREEDRKRSERERDYYEPSSPQQPPLCGCVGGCVMARQLILSQCVIEKT
jgi:hypothetical protein